MPPFLRSLVVLLLMSPAGHVKAEVFDAMRVSVSGGKSISGLRGQADTQAVQVELSRSLGPRTEIGLAFGASHIWQPRSWFGDLYEEGHEKALAGSLSAIGRVSLRETTRVRLYGEFGFGPMLATRKTPAATSRFNFATEAGVGIEMRTRNRAALIVAYRFSHISNGGRTSRNPGWNVSSLNLGVAFRSKR